MKKAQKIEVLLPYKPPFCWDELLRFFQHRQIKGVEYVAENAYRRSIRFKEAGRWLYGAFGIRHVPDEQALSLSLDSTHKALLPQIKALAIRQFDLALDPDVVSKALRKMDAFGSPLYVPGIRLPGASDAFEMTVRAVIGQQITVSRAKTLLGRIVECFGQPIDLGDLHLTHVFPKPSDFLVDDAAAKMGALGIIRIRASAIVELARLFLVDDRFLASDMPLAEARSRLLSIRGIGPWTTDYIVMRTLGATDVFLATDAGIKKALARLAIDDPDTWAKRFSPWQSYVTLSLWHYLKEEQVDAIKKV